MLALLPAAEVGGREEKEGGGPTYVVNNIHSTTPIMLHNLITSMISSSANDPGLRTGFVVFDANGIFAHIFKPDVFECAVAIAVNALSLVFTDDGIL
jgi:hypothetical protein